MKWLSRGLSLFLAVWASPSLCVGSDPNQRQISDACDWMQSGPVAPRSQVRPVYLRCAQGRVEWKYPRGALRVVLRLGTSGRDFRGCLKAGRRMRGARVYLEGHRALHPLFSLGDQRHPQLPRCFVSSHGQVALYVEADLSAVLYASGVELHYDLEAREEDDLDANSECSPCDVQRLMRLFCSSDFAARGRMIALRHNQALDRTEVVVHVQSLFKQSGSVFGDRGQSTCDAGGLGADPPLALGPRHGVLHFPLHCQVERGPGEFMFLGRLRLGCPLVTCAPRWEEWRRARSGAARRGLLPCRTPGLEPLDGTP